jgi:protein ImuB
MFAVVYIPNFSLQAALRHEPDLRSQPVALIDPKSSNPEIIQFNSAAKSHGVSAGLTTSQAGARCEHLKIKTRSPSQEESATEILLQTAYSFSPNVESTALGVCTLELKGLGLLTDEAMQKWAEKILQTLPPFHLEAKIGMALTPDLALLCAQAAHPIAIVRNANEFVAALPVAALQPPVEILEILARWGIDTIGEFLALGRNSVAERLGSAVLELFDRFSTDSIRPLKLVSPPREFSERIEFENEIETAPPLLFVLRRFVEQLSRRLEMVYLVVSEFQLRLGLASGASYDRVFKIPSPTGNVETLFRMLQTHLENVRTDAPITALQLAATPAMPELHQFGLFESTLKDPNQFAETLARLHALLGPENVGTPVLEETHKPDSFRVQTANFDKPSISHAGRRPRKERNGGACLRRLRPPEPAHFEFREEKPALVRSQIFTGAIIGARGPFFSSGHWWDDGRWGREEWDVETANGSFFRIFRSDEGWFVEGAYD